MNTSSTIERSLSSTVLSRPLAPNPRPSCCQLAVVDALETTSSMGSIASLVLLIGGFAMGFVTAWLAFG